MINKPPPFKGLNIRIPIISKGLNIRIPILFKGLNIWIPIIIPIKGRGVINQGSTLTGSGGTAARMQPFVCSALSELASVYLPKSWYPKN